MTRALLTTWGRNILPDPKRSPTMSMPAISGPSMTSIGRAAASRASSTSSATNASIPSTSACSRRSSDAAGCATPRPSPPGVPPAGPGALGELEQPLGRVGSAVEHHVLDPLAQLGVEVVEHRQGTGVHDAHVEPGGDGVVQEDGVHRLADGVAAAERERDVADAARVRTPGSSALIRRTASMNATP